MSAEKSMANGNSAANMGMLREGSKGTAANIMRKGLDYVVDNSKKAAAYVTMAAMLAGGAAMLSGCGGGGGGSSTKPVQITYSLTETANPTSGGKVSPGSGTYNQGQSVSLSETPASGYTFTGWTGTGTNSYTGTDATPPSITMNGNVTETADFTQSSYTFTESASPSAGGTVLPGSGTYNQGQSVSLSETPATGYQFQEWSGTGTGSYTGTTTAPKITMNSDIVEIADFLPQETGTLYVATEGPSSSTPAAYISVINIATNTVSQIIPLSANPISNIVFTPNGSTAYVGCADGNIDAINTASGVVTDIKVPEMPIVSLTIIPNGNTLYVAAANSQQPNVFAIDTSTNAITASISVPDIPAYIAATPDGTEVISSGLSTINNVYNISTSTNEVTAGGGTTSPQTGYISFGSNPAYGPTAYISEVDGVIVDPLNSGTGNGGIGLNNNFIPGQSIQGTNTPLYIGSAVSSTSTTGFLYVLSFPLPFVLDESKIPIGAPPYPVAMTPNSTFAYVLDFTSSGTNIIEVNTSNQNSDTIPITSEVTDSGQIVSTKDSNYLYVIANPVPATALSDVYVIEINSAPHALLKTVPLTGFAVTEAQEPQQ
ncbi:MAG: YncE family protein [Candidatus Micrarchaeaceae archaeon]